jgi:Flp pilus assembly pilin Flp
MRIKTQAREQGKKSGRQRSQVGAAFVEIVLLMSLIAVIGIVSVKNVGGSVMMIFWHAQAGVGYNAGGASLPLPWCQFFPADPICPP